MNKPALQPIAALLLFLLLQACEAKPDQPYTKITAAYPNHQKKVVDIHTSDDAKSPLLRREIYSVKGELISIEDIPNHSLIEYRYYPNGRKLSVQVLRDQKPDGTWRRWYDNGVLAVEMNYQNGRNHGTWKYWDKEGKLTRQIEYWDGAVRWEQSYK